MAPVYGCLLLMWLTSRRFNAQAEAMLTGSNGALPFIPTYWAALPTLRNPAVEGWKPNLFGRHDFTKVSRRAKT